MLNFGRLLRDGDRELGRSEWLDVDTKRANIACTRRLVELRSAAGDITDVQEILVCRMVGIGDAITHLPMTCRDGFQQGFRTVLRSARQHH